jgi:hypothetical protein
MKEKKKNNPQLEDYERVQDLMFFTDVMQHLQYLNLALQGRNKVFTELAQSVLSFHNKIKGFQGDLATTKRDHFPNLKLRVTVFPDAEIKDSKLKQYEGNLETLNYDFENRFEKLKKLKPRFEFLVNPVVAPFVSEVASLETELIELQEDVGLKLVYKSSSLTDFWKQQIPESNYPNLQKTAFRLLSVLGTTYCYESLFSVMKYVKSKHRAVLTIGHLTELLRTYLTSYQPDFKTLTAKINSVKVFNEQRLNVF